MAKLNSPNEDTLLPTNVTNVSEVCANAEAPIVVAAVPTKLIDRSAAQLENAAAGTSSQSIGISTWPSAAGSIMQNVGDCVGLGDGDTVGEVVVGDIVGETVGVVVGERDGVRVGLGVGEFEGTAVGKVVGDAVG